MNSPVMNEDMVVEVLTYFPASEIGKTRLVSKEYFKKSYESWFLNLNIHRTNSLSGYLLQYNINGGYKIRTSFLHERRREFEEENGGVLLDFLPPGKEAEIKACDASHGILLCVIDKKPFEQEEYVVCKPTTKQYQAIPNPETKNHRTLLLCLAVTQLGDNFRYKILRLSKSQSMSFRTLVCEVFDSDLFTWKRLKKLHLPRNDRFIFSNPIQASWFLHWLSLNNKVIRFCLKTETWSFLQTPKSGVTPTLVRYEGKLGVFRWNTTDNGENIYRLWVLSSKSSWVKVKDMKNMELRDNILWSPSNDVVTLCSWDRFCFYNVKTEKSEIIHTNKEHTTSYVCFPFSSDYEKVDFKERSISI